VVGGVGRGGAGPGGPWPGGAGAAKFMAGAALTASPAIAEGKLVIGSQDGRVYCFGE
jgi:hypothetical protein